MTSPRSSIGVRVRPNADNFIRDLRAQMAAKRFTYYVDVGAKMTQANKDVREWARTSLKAVGARVPVAADLQWATRDLQKWRARQRENVTRVPIGVDLSRAERELAVFRAMAKRDIKVSVKADGDLKGLTKLASKDARVRVKADTTSLKAEIDKAVADQRGIVKVDVAANLKRLDLIKSRIEEFVKERHQLDIDVDWKPDPAAAEKLRAEMKKALDGQPAEVDVDADTKGAEAKLDAFTKERRELKAQLDLDTKQARLELLKLRIEEKSRKLTLNVDTKAHGLESFEQTLSNIGKRFGKFSAIRSLDLGPFNFGKPTGLVGTFASATALAGGLPAAVAGVTALSKALVDLAGAAALVPGAIAAVGASIATLAVGTSGVGTAIKAMFDLWNEGSDAQQSQAKAVVSAQNNLTNAAYGEQRAQERLADARKQAVRDLRDLNNELRHGTLNEAQAILDLQKARDRMARGQFANNTDRIQAALDVANAEQNVIDVRERNTRLQEDANEAQAKGVEGSDKVRDATQALAQATQSLAAAQQAVNDASSAGAASKFADALGQLSPNARSFVEAIAGLKGPIRDFKTEIQDDMFAGLDKRAISAFDNLAPLVRRGMASIAQGLNHNILAVFDSLESPQGQSIIERILGGTAKTQEAVTRLIDPLIRGIGTLAAAGTEHMPKLVDLFTRLADRFANFIEQADKDGSLDAFLDRGIEALEKMIDIGINLSKIVVDLGKSFGGDLLSKLRDLTADWHTFLSSTEGQNKLKGFLKDAADLWDRWKPVLKDLPELFGAAADGAHAFLDFALPLLNGFTSALKEAPGLVAGLVGALLTLKTVIPILTTVSNLMTAITLRKAATAAAAEAAAGAGAGAAGAGAGAGAAAGAGGAAAAGGAGLIAPFATALAVPFAVDAFVESRPTSAMGGDADVADKTTRTDLTQADVEKRPVPPGFPKPGSPEAEGAMSIAAMKGDPAAKWVVSTKDKWDQAARYAWLVNHPDQDNKPDFVPPPSYAVGGYTDWPRAIGKAALLHGREYVQPADTVAYYGKDAMEAIHSKQIPRDFFKGFNTGDSVDPNDPRLIDPTQVPPGFDTGAPVAPNPTGGGLQAALGHGMGGLSNVFNNVQNSLNAGQPGPQGVPGAGDPGALGIPGLGDVPGVTDVPGAAPNPLTGLKFTIPGLGWQIPLDGQLNPNARFFGPPASWDPKNPIGSLPEKLQPQNIAAQFGEALLTKGVFGFFGMSGVPYQSSIQGVGQHFINQAFGKDGGQAPGADQSNAAALGLLQTYGNMPLNPAYPGVPTLPNVLGGAGGGAGQQYAVAPGPNGFVKLNLQGTGVLPGVATKDKSAAQVQAILDAPRAPGATVPNANIIDYLKAVGAAFNLHPGSSTIRPGEPTSQHAAGRAMDLFGAPEDRARFVAWWNSDPNRVAATRQLISYDPKRIPLSAMIYGGKAGQAEPYMRDGSLYTENDEVHIALEGVPVLPDYWNSPSRAGSGGGPGPTTSLGPIAPLDLQDIPGGGGQGALTNIWLNARRNKTGATASNKDQLKALAQQMYLRAGMPPSEWNAFDQLITHESNWDPEAKNPGSTAFGLGQFLDSTQANYGITGSRDPVAQLMAIFSYLRNRPDYHGSPAAAWALWQQRQPHWYDSGGWLQPGLTMTMNKTGAPEAVLTPSESAAFKTVAQSFEVGGFVPPPISMINPTPPVQPLPQVDQTPAQKIVAPPTPAPAPSPTPSPAGPAPVPAPQEAPIPEPAPQDVPEPVTPVEAPPDAKPAPPIQQQAPEQSNEAATPPPTGVVSAKPGKGPGPGTDYLDHVHPAVKKGIASGASTIGGLAAMAINSAVSAAAAGASAGAGGSAGAAAGAAGGSLGSFVSGLIQEGGKVIEDLVNVPSSLLVGTLTGGTTENPYGVTQRANQPGGSRIQDNSTHFHGDTYTNNLDDYFRQMDLRDSQKQQGALGAQYSRI